MRTLVAAVVLRTRLPMTTTMMMINCGFSIVLVSFLSLSLSPFIVALRCVTLRYVTLRYVTLRYVNQEPTTHKTPLRVGGSVGRSVCLSPQFCSVLTWHPTPTFFSSFVPPLLPFPSLPFPSLPFPSLSLEQNHHHHYHHQQQVRAFESFGCSPKDSFEDVVGTQKRAGGLDTVVRLAERSV
jgi:hypothetical protein